MNIKNKKRGEPDSNRQDDNDKSSFWMMITRVMNKVNHFFNKIIKF